MRRLMSTVLLVGVLATPLVSPFPAVGADATDACARTADLDLSWGPPAGWEVRTSGSAGAWQRYGETAAQGWRTQATIDGTGAGEAWLISPPVVLGDAAEVAFAHAYLLGAQARGTVEVSTDGGRTFTQVPAARRGHLPPDGGDAATYSGAAPWAPLATRDHHSTADLTGLAGEEVRLAWRLAADGAGTPGWWAVRTIRLRDVADPACVAGARPELACTADLAGSFTGGLPPGWEVDTASNPAGTDAWHIDTTAFAEARTAATGTAAKDDRLVGPPFVATAGSAVTFWHTFALEPDRDGGLLEATVDGGATWQPVDPDWITVGGYNGRTADGVPAWTGANLPDDQLPAFHGASAVHVDLSRLDGEEVRLRWRLLQDDGTAASLPGHGWTIRFAPTLSQVVPDPACARLHGDEPVTCSSLDPPAAVELPPGDGERRDLHVRVALDLQEAIDLSVQAQTEPDDAAAGLRDLEQRMADLLTPMATAYEDIGIDVALTFDVLAPLEADGTPRQRHDRPRPDVYTEVTDPDTEYADELFALAKRQYGGRPPAGADVVYVATDLPLDGPAGVADCVGGLAHPQHAFAVGNVSLDAEAVAAVMAHEVGHLFGAQHHLSNCVESLPAWAAEPSSDGGCTLMAPDVGLVRPQFSTPNAAVVRGYARAYLPGGG